MSTPILIEDNGRTVRAEIDGIIWNMGKEEFLKMISSNDKNQEVKP